MFVLPTLPGEGIPRVLLEAMSAGAADRHDAEWPAFPSLVTHEVNGLLLDRPEAAEDVAGAIARIVRDGRSGRA